MNLFEITYATWKTLTTDNGFSHYYRYVGGARTEANHDLVEVYAGNRSFIFQASAAGADETDWASVFKSAGTEVTQKEDGHALVIGTPVAGTFTSAGLPATTVMDLKEEAEDYSPGLHMEVPALTLGILDTAIAGKMVGPKGLCWLAGGGYWVRTAAARGSALHFTIVDRDNITGAFTPYGIPLSKLDNLTAVSGTFQAGEIVKGGTSNAIAEVINVFPTYLEVKFWVRDDTTDQNSAFIAGETITGQTSGATATLDTTPFTEGGIYEPRKPFIEHHWLEGTQEFSHHPGGSKAVPGGLYFRVKVYNADNAQTLVVDPYLIVGTE